MVVDPRRHGEDSYLVGWTGRFYSLGRNSPNVALGFTPGIHATCNLKVDTKHYRISRCISQPLQPSSRHLPFDVYRRSQWYVHSVKSSVAKPRRGNARNISAVSISLGINSMYSIQTLVYTLSRVLCNNKPIKFFLVASMIQVR